MKVYKKNIHNCFKTEIQCLVSEFIYKIQNNAEIS